MNTEKKVKITIRCPEKLHDAIQSSAQKKDMTFNQFVCTTLAQSINNRFYGNDATKLIRYVQNLRSDMTADGRLIQNQMETLKKNITMGAADNEVREIDLMMLETLAQDFQKRSEIRNHCLLQVVHLIQDEPQPLKEENKRHVNSTYSQL